MDYYLKLVKKNGFNIRDIPAEKQTEEICITAIMDKPMAIRYIANPSEAVCKSALRKDIDVIDFIDADLVERYSLKEYVATAASEQLKLQQQASKDTDDITFLYCNVSLKNIKNPSYAVCLEAVKICVKNFDYVPKQFISEELCEILVKKDGRCLEVVPRKYKTDEIIEAAVNESCWALQYVPKTLRTYELCKRSVKKRGELLQYVPEALKTAELCKIAIEEDGRAIKYVPDKLVTPELCTIAVNQNGMILQFIPDHFKTSEICNDALKENYRAFEFVPKKYKTAKMCRTIIRYDIVYLQNVPKSLKLIVLTELLIEGGALNVFQFFRRIIGCCNKKDKANN